MEINAYNTEGLIDLHIHTNYSVAQNEYMNMNLFPEDLLQQVKEYTDKFGCHASIAITDHNSILGVKKACDIIKENPEEYKNLTFITGCEFSVTCNSLGSFRSKDGVERPIFHTLHFLGYNFDVNDEVINYFSKLKSIEPNRCFEHKERLYPLGSIVFSGKKYLNNLGYNLPLSSFIDFDPKTTKGHTSHPFSENVERFCKFCKTKLGIEEKVINKLYFYLFGVPSKYFSRKNTSYIDERDIRHENVINNNKLDIMEMMSIIENAGGVSVLAHPNLIRLNKLYASKFQRTNEHSFIVQNNKAKKFDNKALDIYTTKQLNAKRKIMEHILDKLIYKAHDPITGEPLKGLMGIELLHSNNMHHKYYPLFAELAEKHNLYATGGSDKHGDYAKCILSLGQIMPLNLENIFPKLDKTKAMFSMYQCKFVDDIIAKNELTRKPGNHQVEMLIAKPEKHIIVDFDNIKRFVKEYAKDLSYEKSMQISEDTKQMDLNDKKLNTFKNLEENVFEC